MRGRRIGALALGLALAAGCGPGTGAVTGPTTATSIDMVDGVGRLPDALPPAREPVDPPAADSSTTAAPDQSVEPADAHPTEEYVLDYGNGRAVDDERLLLVGDSVLEATTFGEPDALDRYVATLGWRLWADAKRGRHMDQAVGTVEDLLDGEIPWEQGWADGPSGRAGAVVPEVVVLMLGNNYEGVRSDYEDGVNALLALLAPARRLVMFTVPLYKPEMADVNEMVRAVAARDDRVVLVDWERLTHERDGVLQGDGLHPTDEGAAILAQLIGRVVGPSPDPPGAVELPQIGVFGDEPLPDWTPPKARETVPIGP